MGKVSAYSCLYAWPKATTPGERAKKAAARNFTVFAPCCGGLPAGRRPPWALRSVRLTLEKELSALLVPATRRAERAELEGRLRSTACSLGCWSRRGSFWNLVNWCRRWFTRRCGTALRDAALAR